MTDETKTGVADSLYGLMEELYPLCRSITGDGLRETLRVIGRRIAIEIHEVPSGTPVLDWTVPREWNIHDAFVKNAAGERVIDFRAHNLHVVNYSVPVRTRMSLEALREHLHTLPEQPDWIPYRTSYYAESWGFCLSENQLRSLPEGEYEVVIDSSLEPGSLSYGELFLPGEQEEEILFSTHVCHPSLCNDNLSGISLAVHLAQALSNSRRRYSYRFLFIPGTIGSISWLAGHREVVPRVTHGLTLVCLGDRSKLTYKKTFGGDQAIDRVVPHVLGERGEDFDVIDFFPYGYDERQFNSPGFRMPVGSLMRGRHGEFPEYHTSADDLAFVSREKLADSFDVCRRIVDVLEGNRRYRSLSPEGEPQLGKRGIYKALGGDRSPGELQMAILWLLACADGANDLLAVARRSGMEFDLLRRAADLLVTHDLIEATD